MDPDGPGEWETTLMTPTRIAAREKFDLVVNGDFFSARNVKDAEGARSGYRPDIWAGAIGPAVTRGKAWSATTRKRPCLVVRKDRRVTIELLDQPGPDIWSAVSGNVMLVEDGKVVPSRNTDRHPRTVVGLDQEARTLIILVVDGRKPGIAAGMTYEELGREMIKLGCRRALNLDGGGSTVMAFREPVTGRYTIVNQPTDGRERAVANALGISIGKKKLAIRTSRPAAETPGK
jgi:exopolysaccharide biosynthesis protein